MGLRFCYRHVKINPGSFSMLSLATVLGKLKMLVIVLYALIFPLLSLSP